MSIGRATAALALLATLACSSGCSGGSPADVVAGQGALDVVASFYPLQYAAERVGGEGVDVASLTKPGAEPHDLELSPQDVGAVSRADLVVYLEGFQPAVDEAVDAEAGDGALDAAPAARLDLTYTPIEEGQAATDEAGAVDPHFWLDPTRLADVGDAIARRMSELRPAEAARFTANAAALRQDLLALDAELKDGLASCRSKDLVTSHNAFGYLARRYGLRQVGITGLTPEQEPDPASLARVAAFVRENRVRTVYSETLVSPEVARTVAAETGARTAVLDPVEGLSDNSSGGNYLAVMRANLATLQEGQPCR